MLQGFPDSTFNRSRLVILGVVPLEMAAPPYEKLGLIRVKGRLKHHKSLTLLLVSIETRSHLSPTSFYAKGCLDPLSQVGHVSSYEKSVRTWWDQVRFS